MAHRTRKTRAAPETLVTLLSDPEAVDVHAGVQDHELGPFAPQLLEEPRLAVGSGAPAR